ncbi:LuxR C-terminal-related transcriptional regulator [Microbacterium sp. BH-3-3-3]|uniref:helix-turn-helix transcriptional regulator n=1 Tax=Microbacterium sp. BH-3-3-3 TaxID=1906742 RepID=UPI00119FB53F|nr:LuxR C-terminal-related transcriptional regulator [Microbacterium sp. BH-3-3-3]
MSDGEPVGTAAVRAAAARVSSQLAPGHGPPSLRDLALLAEVDPGPPPRAWTEAHARLLSAVLIARARTDALGEDLGFVERYFDEGRLTRPAPLSASARADLYASVAEYLGAVGWPQLAARYASDALIFAATPGERYRALSAQAQALSLNAEFPQAIEVVSEARTLLDGEGWAPEDGSLWLLYADALLALGRADAQRLGEIAQESEDARPDDPYWQFAAGLIRLTGLWLRGDVPAALAKARQLLHGSGRARSYRHMRERLLGMVSGLLAVQGEYTEALGVIAQQQSHAGHTICFPNLRATVLLQVGRDQELIDATDGCVTMADHCLFALPSLLTRRAVAFLRLGQEKRASASMASALSLIERTGGSQLTFYMLLAGEVERLLDLVSVERSDLSAEVAAARAALPRPEVSSSEPAIATPHRELTVTERELSRLLLSDLSLGQIAVQRGVSLNTVKSQVRSIYSKWGVSNREALTQILRTSRG